MNDQHHSSWPKNVRIKQNLHTIAFVNLRIRLELGIGEFEIALLRRIKTLFRDDTESHSNFELISQFFNLAETGLRGAFISRLLVTGQYPNYREALHLAQRIEIEGVVDALSTLAAQVERNESALKIARNTMLLWPDTPVLVDVSHTYRHPFVTGIQRVTREILKMDRTNQFTLIEIDANHRVVSKVDPALFNNSGSLNRIDENPKTINNFLLFLHHRVAWFEATKNRRFFFRILRPLARRVKTFLLARRKSDISEGTITNVLLIDHKLNLFDIPNNDGTIEIYRAFLECDVIELQTVFYDLIPFFEPDVVSTGLVGHYAKYFGLVLRSKRVIGISGLVADQLRFLATAFALQNPKENSSPDVLSLNLPSGLGGSAKSVTRYRHRIVVLGSIEPRKNHQQIFGALEILKRQGHDFETILIGNAGWDNELIFSQLETIRQLGINCYRRLNTSDDELLELISSSQMTIFVSEAEGFGLPVVESLSVGTPVIVSQIRPLIDIHSAGIYPVKLHDVSELADKILEVSNTRPLAPQEFDVTWKNWYDEILKF